MAAAQRTRRMVGGIIVAGWIALALAAIPCATLARTVTPSVTYTATPRHHYEGSPTPTPTQTPQRTGDLGTKAVHGRVYDTERGIDAGIAGATVSYAAPSGTGSVQTDGDGDFAFSLFLHDTDLVVVGAAAPGFHASEVRLPGLQLWFQSEIDLGLEPIGRTAFRIAGRVQRDPYCSVESPVTVVLDPLQGGGRSGSVELSATGDFLFEDVPDGDYTLRAESDCQPSYAAPVQVYVRGADVYTEIAFDALCPPVLVVDPPRGPPGTVVAVRGRCYYIHSGGSADVYLDRTLVTSLYGDTSGNYSPELLIPPGTAPGLARDRSEKRERNGDRFRGLSTSMKAARRASATATMTRGSTSTSSSPACASPWEARVQRVTAWRLGRATPPSRSWWRRSATRSTAARRR